MEKMSESEEMYLITVARYVEDGYEGPVPLSRLAERLSVAPVSVNQMIKKLEEAGLVDYIPYKGVVLTATGRRTARSVLRRVQVEPLRNIVVRPVDELVGATGRQNVAVVRRVVVHSRKQPGGLVHQQAGIDAEGLFELGVGQATDGLG